MRAERGEIRKREERRKERRDKVRLREENRENTERHRGEIRR
jgi:hypothetical protein